MKLKELKITSGGGISPNAPILIDFSKSKRVAVIGDNGLNKTSIIEGLLMACGQLGGQKQVEKYANQETGKIDIDFAFKGNDRCDYQVRVTKSKLSLIYEGENQPEPIAKIKQLLGVVGVSPMDIKNGSMKEIVKWLASYSSRGAEEYEKQIGKIKDAMKLAKDARASANRSMKALDEYLNTEPLFTKWEASEKKYKAKIDLKDLSEKLTEAGRNSDKFLQQKERLKQQTDRRDNIEAQIQRLQDELLEVNKGIKMSEKFVDDNKDAGKVYDEIKAQYDGAAQEVVNYNKWQEIKRKKKERDEFETVSQTADAKEKELLQEMKEVQAEILPDIKGVELVLEETEEEGKRKKEGFYRNGLTSAQMSESEWWATVMEIWKKNKVKIVVIDNYQSLGSMAAGVLDKLEKDGAYILVAEMNREQKELLIEYQE